MNQKRHRIVGIEKLLSNAVCLQADRPDRDVQYSRSTVVGVLCRSISIRSDQNCYSSLKLTEDKV